MMNRRWAKRPEGSNWGEWGEDDQCGRLNLVDNTKVLQGVAEVKVGKTFCLSLPLDYPGGNVLNPFRFPPQLKPVLRNGKPYYNFAWSEVTPNQTDIAADDCVFLHTQYSTQWDSLAHRGSVFDVQGNGKPQAVYYNGYRAGEDVLMDGPKVAARALGIENMANHGVQGRGVLVNLADRFGETPRKEVGYDDLMRIIDEDHLEIEAGDILCIWSGLDRMIMRMAGSPDPQLKTACAVLDGFDKNLLRWIESSGIAAIAADNLAVEAVHKALPEGYQGSNLPLHELCLFKLGIHLGELWYFAELADWLKNNARSRFLLTAPPLRLTGAVGSPVTPIATV